MSEPDEQHERPRVIARDLAEQIPSKSGALRAYYEDKEFECTDCGKTALWTAQQQKWWYEVAKGS